MSDSTFKCQTLRQTAHATLQKFDHLSLLWLKGSPVERARAHGELIGSELTDGNLNLFVALSTRGIPAKSIGLAVVDKALQYLVRWALVGAPQAYIEETQSMADAMKVPALKLRRALLLPDLAAYSWALLSRQGKNIPTQGCTSAVVTDDQGNFLQGRNLDFPGSPSFDQNPLLVIHLPEKGSSELKHVSIGTHGLQFSGITGFNEAGMTFAVHQNYTRLLSIRGVPMPFVGELVLRSAKNLNEAVEIIRQNRPGPLWTFIIADQKTGEALTVEVSNTHFSVRKKEGPYFSQTNHLLNPEMRRDLSLMEAGTVSNSSFRFEKALEEMKSWEKPTPEKMARLLSWQKDRKVFSPVSDVLKSLTIQSVIYEKAANSLNNNFYVTIDSAPAPTGRWAQIKMDSFWKKESFTDSDFQVFDFVGLAPDLRKAQTKWADVYAVESLRLYPQVVEKLKPLVTSADGYLALAAMQLKAQMLQDSSESVQNGLKATTPATPKLIQQGLLWMEIVTFWHFDKKEEAQKLAQKLLEQKIIDPELEIQARRVLQRKKPSESSLRPGFDFFGGYLQGMPSRPKP